MYFINDQKDLTKWKFLFLLKASTNTCLAINGFMKLAPLSLRCWLVHVCFQRLGVALHLLLNSLKYNSISSRILFINLLYNNTYSYNFCHYRKSLHIISCVLLMTSRQQKYFIFCWQYKNTFIRTNESKHKYIDSFWVDISDK